MASIFCIHNRNFIRINSLLGHQAFDLRLLSPRNRGYKCLISKQSDIHSLRLERPLSCVRNGSESHKRNLALIYTTTCFFQPTASQVTTNNTISNILLKNTIPFAPFSSIPSSMGYPSTPNYSSSFQACGLTLACAKSKFSNPDLGSGIPKTVASFTSLIWPLVDSPS
jgi:hypothetical protein